MSEPEYPIPMPGNLVRAVDELIEYCQKSSTCQAFPWGSRQYKDSIRHFLPSSSQVAQLAVVPGEVKDVVEIIKIIAGTYAPFAVKGGGHAMAPRMSSSRGIQIDMCRFCEVHYDPTTQQITVGSGCLWDQVYRVIARYDRNVIGGATRDSVGVAGWLLGGGWSLKSNRYGLGIDNIVEITIVTPNGKIRKASASKNRDLFNALRGGGNNFGIVISFVLKTYPQTKTWGASFSVLGNKTEDVKKGLVAFVAKEKRPEAVMVVAFRYLLVDGEVENTVSILCVFDGPKPVGRLPFRELGPVITSGAVWVDDPVHWSLGMPLWPFRTWKPPFEIVPARRQPHENAPSRGGNGSNDSDNEFDDALHALFEEISVPRWLGGQNHSGPLSHDPLTFTSGPSFSLNPVPSDDGDDDDHNTIDRTAYGNDVDRNKPEGTKGVLQYNLHDDGPRNDPLLAKVPTPTSHDPHVAAGRLLESVKVDTMGERNERGRFGCLMIKQFTKPLVDKMVEEAELCSKSLKKKHGISVVIDAWPAHTDIFKNSPADTAYPHKPDEPVGPMLAYFRWQREEDDEFWIKEMKDALERIRIFALPLGLVPPKPAYYSNLCLEDVPSVEIFRENMPWLKKVKAKYDRNNLMGQAGGFKIPLF